MNTADQAIVYVDAHVFEHRKMELIPVEYIRECFGDVQVINDRPLLEQQVMNAYDTGDNILLMSSGTFSQADFPF